MSRAESMEYWDSNEYPGEKNVISGPVGDVDHSTGGLRKCISFDSKDENGWTALHWAAASGNVAVAQALLDSGGIAFLETRTLKKVQFGHLFIWASLTPLHIAAVAGNTNVAKVLIEAGANVDVLDNLSCTPLDTSLFWGHLGFAQVLLAAGAQRNGLVERESTITTSGSIRSELTYESHGM